MISYRLNVIKLFSFLLILALGQSCVSVKKTRLLQMAEERQPMYEYQNNSEDYRIKQGDEIYLGIDIMDTKEMLSFNESGMQQAFYGSEMDVYIMTYTVNDSGNIYLPVIGKLYLQGLTVNQVHDTVQSKVEALYASSLVTVRLANQKITLVGEVVNPGTYTFTDKITIFQALGMAGNPTAFADRKNVRIIRKNSKGENEMLKINLLKDSALESPAYYLHPDDIIYIEPIGNKNFAFSEFPYEIVLTTISTLVIVLSFF